MRRCRWSLIAGRLPGRTDNEIKNYWNTHLKKKIRSMGIDPSTHRSLSQHQLQTVPTEGQDGSDEEMSFNPAPLPQQRLHRSTTNAAAGLKPMPPMSSFNHGSSNVGTAAATRDRARDENYQQSLAIAESFLRDSVMYPDDSHMIQLPKLKELQCAASDHFPVSRSVSSSLSMDKSGADSLSLVGSPCSPVSILQQCCSFGCADRECLHMIENFSNSCRYSDLVHPVLDHKPQPPPRGIFGESPSITSESTASSACLVDRGTQLVSSYFGHWIDVIGDFRTQQSVELIAPHLCISFFWTNRLI